jgi:hypothetical protein
MKSFLDWGLRDGRSVIGRLTRRPIKGRGRDARATCRNRALLQQQKSTGGTLRREDAMEGRLPVQLEDGRTWAGAYFARTLRRPGCPHHYGRALMNDSARYLYDRHRALQSGRAHGVRGCRLSMIRGRDAHATMAKTALTELGCAVGTDSALLPHTAATSRRLGSVRLGYSGGERGC